MTNNYFNRREYYFFGENTKEGTFFGENTKKGKRVIFLVKTPKKAHFFW
jgi:hypothetical protein